MTIEADIERIPRRRTANGSQRAVLRAEANLPVNGKVMRVMVFGLTGIDGARAEEVVALVNSRDPTAVPLVRVHSACLTGDILGSQKCDCGDQLKVALRQIQVRPHGMLLYMLNHEGRGIGLTQKIRAYALQDGGDNTIEANLNLGLPVEARDFIAAAEVLHLLNSDTIDLLTNNPLKIEGLETHGVTVRHRVPIQGDLTEQNAQYLLDKDQRMGHIGALPAHYLQGPKATQDVS
ncbi:GTP cyclohydrolase II RibA [Jatrophihabitans lederbergiae]|jgi:GTP cyclohydrolase II|uniref:GTP cyclohydrolase II n=1 Tax=Jatrophihabitans lederbergiae TaxID=3075547 RepID=A0ABU2JBB4_9ACTN|nr:GTP cyclohydrolase II RibA [Jatrophihabitans sp. DSM 44399]MDT0261769.1 GTP cyclohydrolase II RibA [Jatrophihabitans sp. DSM 44399]